MEKLIPIEYGNQRILTTEQLAEIYETDVDNIKMNFNNNKKNFEEGKHYYFLEGNTLREFKRQVNNVYPPLINKFTSNLYLWTERGASRHCKILETDKAWQQFDSLEENYFHKQEPPQLKSPYDTVKSFSIGEVASLVKVTIPVMTKQGSSANEIAKQVQLFYNRFGIPTINNFVKQSPYEQLSLPITDIGYTPSNES